MTEVDHKYGKVVPIIEDADRDDWCARKLPFIQPKNDCGDDAKDDETNDCHRSPGVLGAAEFEAQEEHQRGTNNQNETDPVDCAKTFEDTFEVDVDFEEEEEA